MTFNNNIRPSVGPPHHPQGDRKGTPNRRQVIVHCEATTPPQGDRKGTPNRRQVNVHCEATTPPQGDRKGTPLP
jgi:hypothetical protein